MFQKTEQKVNVNKIMINKHSDEVYNIFKK